MNQEQQIDIDDEQRLTKRQRRQLRKQEVQNQHMSGQKRKRRVAGILWAVVGVAVVAGIWWLVVRGSSARTSSGLDAMKQDTQDPYVGNADAAVVVREFSDFQCSACKLSQPTIQNIITTYGDQIKFEFNDFPLVSIHKNALFAAEAAQCVKDQGKFWPFHDVLYEKQSEWAELSKEEANAKFVQYGVDLGVDAATLKACIDTRARRDIVQDDINQGNAAKVNATPTFFVNDEKLVIESSVEELRQLIDQALAKAQGDASTNSAEATTNQ